MILSLDLESRSPVHLPSAGAYRYFEHEYTEIMCAAWALDDGPIDTWFPGQPCPEPVAVAIKSGCKIAGWNVNFERQGINRKLYPLHGWPLPALEQYQDTAAQAAAQSLPRALEKAAAALRLPVQKDQDGANLMHNMSKARQPRKGEKWQEVYWNEGDIDRLAAYCRQDVAVERAIRKKLQPLSDTEQLLWQFDQRINDRGIGFDLALVDDMMKIAAVQTAELDARLFLLTSGHVEKCTQTAKLKEWLVRQGLKPEAVASLGKDVIDTVFALPMNDDCRMALLTWQKAGKASVRKLQAAKACAGADGRARGLLRYHGAISGRWSGQLFQPHNLPRGSGTVFDQDQAIDLIRYRDSTILEWAYDDPLTVLSDCLRGVLCATGTHRLMAGDYKNIEARLIAWMSGNVGKLDSFRRQDDKTGPEIYELAAAAIYRKPVEYVTKKERQTGKTAELALGFGGGVDALAKMALNYHIDMSEALDPLWDAATVEEKDMAVERYRDVTDKGNNDWLPAPAWMACWLIVRAWRKAHPATVTMWSDYMSECWHALDDADKDFPVGKVSFRRSGGFMWMTLPSGRRLSYPTPLVENLEVPWSDKRKPPHERERKNMLTVLAFDQGRASRYPFYAGLTFQHSVQAVARDIMATGMARVEAAGYPVVMTVHDEVISEIPNGFGSTAQYGALLCDLPLWAEGLPLIADTWSGQRYRK